MGALNDYLAEVNRQHHAIRRFVRRDAEQPARQRLSVEEKAELARGEPVAVWGPRSRVDRYVGMLAKLGDPTIPLRQAVLSNAEGRGTFAVIAPLLAELAAAHEDLLAAASDCADARQFLPPDIQERHRKAFLSLMPYRELTSNTNPADPRSPVDTGDPITLAQAACLVLVSPKTVHNRKTSNPPPRPDVAGVWGYAKLRPWLLDHWPKAASRLPKAYSEARKLFSAAD